MKDVSPQWKVNVQSLQRSSLFWIKLNYRKKQHCEESYRIAQGYLLATGDSQNTQIILTQTYSFNVKSCYSIDNQPINYSQSTTATYVWTYNCLTCIHSDTRSTLLRCFFNQDPYNDITALFDLIVRVSEMFSFWLIQINQLGRLTRRGEFRAIVGETAYCVRSVRNSPSSKCRGDICDGRDLAMRLAPLCVTQVLAEAQESRQADDRGWGPRSYLKVQLRVPYSFPLEEEGGRGREESINNKPLHHYLTEDLAISMHLWIFQCHCRGTRGKRRCTGCPTR